MGKASCFGMQVVKTYCFRYFVQAFGAAEEHLGIPPQMSASEMVTKDVPDTLMIVSYVSQYHEVFKNETPGSIVIHYFYYFRGSYLS